MNKKHKLIRSSKNKKGGYYAPLITTTPTTFIQPGVLTPPTLTPSCNGPIFTPPKYKPPRINNCVPPISSMCYNPAFITPKPLYMSKCPPVGCKFKPIVIPNNYRMNNYNISLTDLFIKNKFK